MFIEHFIGFACRFFIFDLDLHAHVFSHTDKLCHINDGILDINFPSKRGKKEEDMAYLKCLSLHFSLATSCLP